MPIEIDGVNHLTPEEVCEMCRISQNTIDTWYLATKHGNMDMPYIMNPFARSVRGSYRLREGARPNFLLPEKKFKDWILRKIEKKT